MSFLYRYILIEKLSIRKKLKIIKNIPDRGLKFLKQERFSITQGITLLLLKTIDLPANYALNLLIFITEPRNSFYD